jgi:hypothetical protein
MRSSMSTASVCVLWALGLAGCMAVGAPGADQENVARSQSAWEGTETGTGGAASAPGTGGGPAATPPPATPPATTPPAATPGTSTGGTCNCNCNCGGSKGTPPATGGAAPPPAGGVPVVTGPVGGVGGIPGGGIPVGGGILGGGIPGGGIPVGGVPVGGFPVGEGCGCGGDVPILPPIVIPPVEEGCPCACGCLASVYFAPWFGGVYFRYW